MIRNRFLIHKSGCAVCGKPLTYSTSFEKHKCYYCEKDIETDIFCDNGHFVCDACHRVDANDLIQSECLNYKGTNPLVFVNRIMENKLFNLHGPEHHFLVPAALLIAYNNATGNIKNLKEALKILRTRMVKIPGNICGTNGGCGAVLGLGAFVSYITKTTALSEKKWAKLHAVTAAGLMQVSKYGGPRCCKRNTYIAILEGITWLSETLIITLDKPNPIVCGFHLRNKECLETDCLFYKSH
ncbi:DUF5714 domain-containing protein [Salinivirga cyanobacteriivorans]